MTKIYFDGFNKSSTPIKMKAIKGEKMTNRINSVSFTGNMARAYLQKKAAQQAKIAAENTKEAARALINNNKKAAKTHDYLPEGVYFGPVNLTERNVGELNRVNSAAMARKPVERAATETIGSNIEANLHYFG